MRIEEITVSWFRGAAQEAILAPGSKSIVVYGENGSGKSTFTDALEYLIRDGKIEHLAHEYSGARQEKAVRNTEAPEGIPSIIRVNFKGGEFARAEIHPDGTSSVTTNPPELMTTVQDWKIQQLILRQHEVADFVHSSKGQKYSALLPLLGLDPLEQAADNVRQLASRVRNRGELQVKQARLSELRDKAANILPSLARDEVVRSLRSILERYPVASIPEGLPSLASSLESAISERIKITDPENRRHLLLSQIHEEALTRKLKAMDEADKSAKDLITSLDDHRIAVLEKAQVFSRELEDDKEIECPACGQRIAAREFQEHVETQLRLLEQARVARDTAREARRALAASLGKVLTNVKAPEVRAWLDIESQLLCIDALSQLAGCSLDQSGEDWQNQQVAILRSCVPVVSAHVAESVQAAPPSTKQLLDDLNMVSVAASLPEIEALTSEIRGIDGLIRALEASELAARDAIREQTLQIVEGISGQAQRLWSKLHPDEPIEDIRLHIPDDADKAIDIGLTFFGHLQPSPRLTLSEGHRNSLGLCIFLALAQLGTTDERPIILDDVMSSLDRGHRGMLVDVICQDLADRQVIIFTHDREWFTELKLRLPAAQWKYLVLRPWESPGIGIQWSPSVDTFDDAKALVATNAKQAGNAARTAMEEVLSLAAERLKLTVCHLRGDRNDRRYAADFLTRFISEGDRLRRRQGESWPPYVEPISDWRDTLALLGAWANRASHTGSLIPQEARRLIDSCEKAVSHFRCPSCHTWLWNSDQTSGKRLRCDCGDIQWRYG